MENEIPANPYDPTTQVTSLIRPRWRARGLLVALSVGCYSLAGVLFFCSQSWTFYTPYSVETTWEVFLPGRMSFAIGITLGVLALIALLLLGTLFLLIALIPRRKRSVDSAAEV